MKYEFKGFHHIEARKHANTNDGSFIYTVVMFIHDTETHNVTPDVVEIMVSGATTNADTDPYIMGQLMMRVNAMWNGVK